MRPDHHPTPFSADEIRDGFVPGTVVRSRVERAGAEPVVHVRVSIAADPDGGIYEFWTESLDGRRLEEPVQQRSIWRELQAHASMPVDATTIDRVTIDVPMGTFDGLRYTRVEGETVDTFWFATSMPGAPIRMEERVAGELVFSSTAIAEQRP